MIITVKLFATLRDGRFDAKEIEYPEGTTIRQIAEELSISPEEANIIFVNSRHAKFEQELYDGDILGLFPLIGGG